MATDVAKTEQITNTTVDAKEPQTVAENSATPPVEAEKAIPNENAAKDDKSETPGRCMP